MVDCFKACKWETKAHKHREHGDLINLLSFLIKGNVAKKNYKTWLLNDINYLVDINFS